MMRANKMILMSVAVILVLCSVPILAAQKKGSVMGPAGFWGVMQPPWPARKDRIQVTFIDEGSPASKSELKVGDTIVGVGNKKFEGFPAKVLAQSLEEAESSDGKLSLLLMNGEQVQLKLAVLGAYSKTAPYNCPKTDKIIAQAAERLVAMGASGTVTHTGLLGLMATGEKKYIDYVGKKLKPKNPTPEEVESGKLKGFQYCTWIWGYRLIVKCEYYLLTKDEAYLKEIAYTANALAQGQDGLGLWGHNLARPPKHRAPGYGVMNQVSLSNLIGLILAQKCGIKDPVVDKAIEKAYSWYADNVGRGGLSYGSAGSKSSIWNSNGTSGSAAVAMSLMDNQKGASFFSQCAAVTPGSLTSGHACSFFNPLWTPLGAGLSGPKITHKFFKDSLWYWTPARSWKGGFPQKDKAGYVAGQALLMYCLPRKALMITGRESDSSIYKEELFARPKAIPEDVDGIMEVLNHDFPQIRGKAIGKLQSKLTHEAKVRKSKTGPGPLAQQMLSMLKKATDKQKTGILQAIGGARSNMAEACEEGLARILRDKNESIAVRRAAAMAMKHPKLGSRYIKEIVDLALMQPESDPFRRLESELARPISSIFDHVNPYEPERGIDKEKLYKLANRMMDHPRQHARAAGTKLLMGMPKEDLGKIAAILKKSLDNASPNYHSYSKGFNKDGYKLLAELGIKDGLEHMVEIFVTKKRGAAGKWAFKYAALRGVLKAYGGNAEPYLETLEKNKGINKPKDRFTPAWQKMAAEIRADKNRPKMITFEEALKAAQ